MLESGKTIVYNIHSFIHSFLAILIHSKSSILMNFEIVRGTELESLPHPKMMNMKENGKMIEEKGKVFKSMLMVPLMRVVGKTTRSN
jgi:hypothetical protein